MMFVKEESEENTSEVETWRIKHEEPETWRIKHEEHGGLMKVKEERQDLYEEEEKHQDQKNHDVNGEKSPQKDASKTQHVT
ncbi:hypothetical protein cypCar_00031672 [Cyprinus carpio]|nr:hypothetical protein cypCar_00031672 [Cyprinus carpio]